MSQNPLLASVVLAVGIALLLLGGNWLVIGSVSIARRVGMSTLVIGLTLVAFGTSSPELFFNVIAASSGHGELSFGNVVGSNIANIGLILGIAALYRPLAVHGRVVSKELPWLLIVSAAMVALAVLPWGEAAGRDYGRLEGVILMGVFALFMVAWYRLGRRDAADPLVRELGQEARAEARRPPGLAAALVVTGLAGLVGGGKLAQVGAVELARWLGFSEALIGLTIVAVATSLPELATSIIACRKGHDDLAVGNVVGSNLFNILLVLGATAAVAPVPVPPATGLSDLGAMMAITIVLLPLALSHRGRIRRWEGALLLALYTAYMAWSVVRE